MGALKIEKGNFQELSYVVNFESYFGKQIFDLRSYMPCIKLEENMMFSSLVGELNKDLKTSLIFQQWEFDMGVSSLGMNGTSVSPHPIEDIEKICIWVFHGLFDVWVDRERVE